MHENPKAPPPAELSLKYMAWDIKEISKSLKELVEHLKGSSGNAQAKKAYKEEDLF